MVKPIVILHGWGSDLAKWKPVKLLLQTKGYQVWVPQLPGFNDQLSRPWGIADYSNWLNQWLTKKKLKRIFLVGHSFGGQIATHFTSHYPEKVNKLVLINAAAIRHKLSLKKVIFLPLAKIGQLIFKVPPLSYLANSAKKSLYKLIKEPDYHQASPTMKQTLKLILSQDQRNNLVKINQPTLLLWGGQDTYTPLSDGKLIHQLLKNSTIKVFSKSSHALPFQKPSQVVKQILWFIS